MRPSKTFFTRRRRLRRSRMIAAAAAVVLLPLTLATGAEPRPIAAIVEEVTGTPAIAVKGPDGRVIERTVLQAMVYVARGDEIALAPGDAIVLGYFVSCLRETIKSGILTVGARQSELEFGDVERRRVPCDVEQMQLTAEQANQSAGTVMRIPPGARKPARRDIILHSPSPLLETGGHGRLLIERVDRPGEQVEITIAKDKLIRGSFYDLARDGIMLSAGGVYAASLQRSSDTQTRRFKIDAKATASMTAAVGRLVSFR